MCIRDRGEKSTQLYTIVDSFVSRLKCLRIASVDAKQEEDESLDADYIVDEKARTATLTARGIKKAEEQFNLENLSDPENTTLSHHINQAIKAHGVMKRDIDYVVKDGEVIIVDEFTGRLICPAQGLSAIRNGFGASSPRKHRPAAARRRTC